MSFTWGEICALLGGRYELYLRGDMRFTWGEI